MEENKMKVLFNRVIPENYDDLQNMFKEVFKQDNIKNLTFDDGKEKINITEDNYKNYVISAIELSHTTKNILVNVDQKKEDDKLEIKFNENLDLLKRKIKENNELKKKNKDLEQKIQKLNEEEEIRKKEINEEDKKDVMSELERKNEMINQKCKILDGFEEFKKYMKEDKKYLDNLNKVEKEYKEKFESEIKTILEDIKNKLINETRTKCEEEFKKYINELEEAESKRKEEYDNGLENINYRMLIESSDLIHNIRCKQCEKKPIIGVLYKCAQCTTDYYLCEKCEDKNYHSDEHPHNFIKIRKSDKMIIDKDAINKNKEDKKDNQSRKNNFENNQRDTNYKKNNNNYNQYEIDKNRNNQMNNVVNQNINNIRNNNRNALPNQQPNDINDFYDVPEETKINNPMLNDDGNNFNIFQSMANQLKNIGGNKQMEKVEQRNQMEYQKNEIYNTNLYNFVCEFPNNGVYEFNLSKRIKPEIIFNIKNIDNKDWRENEMFLKTNKNSQLKINDYKLYSIRKGESKRINLNIPSINEITDGTYNIILDFCVNNKIYGEPIKFKVKIVPDQNLLKIIEFRNIYQLSEKEYPNEQILPLLKKNKFDYDKTFDEMFQEN